MTKKKMFKKDLDMLMEHRSYDLPEETQFCPCAKCEDQFLKEKNYLKCVFWALYKAHAKQINEMNQRRLEIIYKIIKERIKKIKKHEEMLSEKYPFRAKHKIFQAKENLPAELHYNEDNRSHHSPNNVATNIGGLKEGTSNAHMKDSSDLLPSQLLGESKSSLTSRAEAVSKGTNNSIIVYSDSDQFDRTLLLVEQFNRIYEGRMKNQKDEKYPFRKKQKIFSTKENSALTELLTNEDNQSSHFLNNDDTINVRGSADTTSNPHMKDSSDLLPSQLLGESKSSMTSRAEAVSKGTNNSIIVYSDSDQFDRTLLLVEQFNRIFEGRMNQKKILLEANATIHW